MTQNFIFGIPDKFELAVTISLDPATLAAISPLSTGINAKLEKIMATLDDLVADTAAETTAIGSISTLIQGLKDQIANVGLSASDQAKVDAVFAGMEANKAALATALQVNVPVSEQTNTAQGNPGSAADTTEPPAVNQPSAAQT